MDRPMLSDVTCDHCLRAVVGDDSTVLDHLSAAAVKIGIPTTTMAWAFTEVLHREGHVLGHG
jgi:hypothetical protein